MCRDNLASNRMSLFLYLRGKELQSAVQALYFVLVFGFSVTVAAGALREM
jgi:hypothetical protein